MDWWFKSDAGLLARLAIGASIFAILALWDLKRKGPNATRWREYLFLVVAAVASMIYGLAHDFIAASISWEYFYYGKGISQALGPHVPPDWWRLHWEACKVGLKATWSAGLIIGVALLIANNPRKDRRQLPYAWLLRSLIFIFMGAAAGSVLGAALGRHGLLTWTSTELRLLVRDDLFRPRELMTAYGMNLGAYAGGIAATMVTVCRILNQRTSQPNRLIPSNAAVL
ncbi:MAG TPA: hypothetical protein VN541_02005 [Tepidisphaeraceae bacterium]|nr:hypothetical protein [Tepidisphaeraceae bacterium]